MLEAATNAEPAALSVALRSSKESSDKSISSRVPQTAPD
jgi:hypothetical protein